ncbi:MAG: hypothetical protein GXP26_06205 [Planctomycetes bacterium]|nr:hypothetical protein [Planctomycetota bacterium]
MSTSPSSDDKSQRLEQIVAYLDGELSPVDSARVEQQLAADDDFRQELQSIDRAWAALDKLPSTVVDDSFLQTTMGLVVDSARREVAEKTQILPVLKRNRWLSKVLLGIAATLLGVLVFRLVWSNPNRLLLADLPVIYQLDIYSQFEKTSFLRMLDKAVQDDWPLSQEEFAGQEEQLKLVSAPASQREWLEGITDDQRVALRADFNRFRGLPEKEQERLRSLHQEIESAEDGEELRQTTIRYEQWLNNLAASEQYSLREMPATARARRVAKLVHEKAKDDALNLSPAQLKQFWEKMQPRMDELEKRAIANLPERQRERYQNATGGDSRRKLLWLTRLTPGQMKEHFFPVVLDALPSDAREQFLLLPPDEKKERLFGWWRQIQMLRHNHWKMPERDRRGEALQKELEEFFVEELDPGKKERLLALPHDQMQRQLERMYRGVPSHRGRGGPHDRAGPPEHDRRPPPGFKPPPRLKKLRQDFQGKGRPERGDRNPKA